MPNPDSVNRVKEELKSLGYKPRLLKSPVGTVVVFEYTIEVGSNKDSSVLVGVSFQDEVYPDYPPHWVHVSPPISDGRGGSIQKYREEGENGNEWLAMSRPPGSLWDQLPTKHMASYIKEHLRKIWRNV